MSAPAGPSEGSDLEELLENYEFLPMAADLHDGFNEEPPLTAAAELTAVDLNPDPDEESDASLVERVVDNIQQLTPKDAQRLLRRRTSLVLSGLMREESMIVVPADGRGMHFLIHARSAESTPLINLCGPGSGTLCPGDESVFHGVGVLQLSGSKNSKAPAASFGPIMHDISVTGYREVQLGPRHGCTGTSLGSISSNIRGPKTDSRGTKVPFVELDFIDIKPKVSLIVCAQKAESPSKRQRLELTNSMPMASSEAIAVAVSAGGEGAANAPTLVAGDLHVQGDISATGVIRGELQSPNADFAEWYRRADEAEEIRDGDVVLHQGHRISRREREGSPPVSFWSVVSSRPCVKGGVPSDNDARKVGSHGLLSA